MEEVLESLDRSQRRNTGISMLQTPSATKDPNHLSHLTREGALLAKSWADAQFTHLPHWLPSDRKIYDAGSLFSKLKILSPSKVMQDIAFLYPLRSALLEAKC